LTIKFTRHTQLLAASFYLLAIRRTGCAEKSYGAPACSSHGSGRSWQVADSRKNLPAARCLLHPYVHQQAIGTHKIHFAL